MRVITPMPLPVNVAQNHQVFNPGLDATAPSFHITRTHVLQLLHEGISAENQKLILPPGLLEDITSAIWKMAVDEPCGFRGCVLTVQLCTDAADSDPKKRVPLLTLKNNTVITHRIDILLYPDTSSWLSRMARIFRPKNTAVASHFSSEVVRLCRDL